MTDDTKHLGTSRVTVHVRGRNEAELIEAAKKAASSYFTLEGDDLEFIVGDFTAEEVYADERGIAQLYRASPTVRIVRQNPSEGREDDAGLPSIDQDRPTLGHPAGPEQFEWGN